MELRKKSLCIFFVITLFGTISTASAKSVYVISDTQSSQLQKYKVDGTNLIYKTDYVCISDPPTTAGAIGLAIDESEYGDFLFVTFESSPAKIEIIDANTMQYVDSVTATGAYNLAGIVVDKGKRKVYAIDRDTHGRLFIYSWDAQTKTLIPALPSPYYVLLPDCENTYGFDIALDEENGLLYVADNTDQIKYYNTSNWSKKGQIPASCNVISVAIDIENQLLYYGSIGGGYGEGDPNLYQYDIASKTENVVTIGCSVAGIAVDQATSLVYMTTFGAQEDSDIKPYPKDRLFVYDSNLNEKWYSDDIGNPAGVCVESSLVKLTKFYDVNDCVVPADDITYTISYSYPDEPDNEDINDVVIIDYLPDYLEYLPDPCGTYDSNHHTVTWNIGTISPGDANSVTLTVTVNDCVMGCGVIINSCKVKSGNSVLGIAFESTPLCCASNPFPACDAKVDLYVNGLKLLWCAGYFAADADSHDVYFGTDYNSVLNANDDDLTGIYRGRQTETEYELTNLDLLTTYYWRVDEVNEPNIWPGPVWSFTTGDFYVIDDFEYYTVSDPEGTGTCPYYYGNDRRIDLNNDMRFWWLDGHVDKNPQGDCGGDYPEDYNPVIHGGDLTRLPGSRIIRTNYGRTGYGMNYYYNNFDVDNSQFPPELDSYEDRYSEILRYYAGGVDFTLEGKIDVNRAMLVLYYKGNPDNAVDPNYDRMYVVLEDTDEVYCDYCSSSCNYCRGDDAQIDHNEPAAALATYWTQWKIKLSDFNEINPDINFDSIRSVRIGFGLRGNTCSDPPGGEGTVIFDDIRLYPCSEADLDGDCDVDFYDYAIFAAAWLTNLGQPNYDPNCDLAESNEIDCNDLAFFCDDWLLGASLNLEEAISMGLGGGSGFEQSAYFTSISEEIQPTEIELFDIQWLLDWLEELWLTEPPLREIMTEAEYLEFIKAIEDSINN